MNSRLNFKTRICYCLDCVTHVNLAYLKLFNWPHLGHDSLKYCKYCEITFPTDNGLRLHNLSVDHQLLCPECPPESSGTGSESGDGTFANESLLKAHFKQHHPHSALLINACQICQKVFKSEHALRTHLKIHTGNLLLECF